MKIIPGSWIHRYWKRLILLFTTLALVMGLVSCEGSCSSTPVQYDLTIPSIEGGEVIISGEGTYADGQIVTIEAVADECYEFVSWTGADVDDPYSPITTITMDEAKTVTANFALLSYELTVASTGDGQVTSPGEDTFTYDCGKLIDLVAAAEEGYYFVNWSGDVETLANINAPTTTVTMMGDYSITANFELIPLGQFVLTTSSTAGGSVTDPGEGNFLRDEGTVVEMVAVSDECYEFVNWTGDNVADPYSATTNITMDADKSVTANFALLSYNLTAGSTDGGEVTSPGEDTFAYDCGTVVDLVAEADLGFHFVEWTGDISTIADVTAAETTITMGGNYSITANFGPFSGGDGTAEDPYQIVDWYRLDDVRNYLSSHFILINDLDSNSIGYTELASTTAHEGKGWQPIAVNNKFVGSFDGQGYEICDLFINRPDELSVGLFHAVGQAGVIENVGVHGNVIGYDDASGLVGRNLGTVSNSHSTCNVIGNLNVGGLVGKNDNSGGTVINCYATGNVTGNDNVGGLVGWNREGTMSRCYATGCVTGNDSVGGLVGKNSDTASNCYATGRVTGNDNVGGLAGRNDNWGSVSDSYSTGGVTGSTHVGGLIGRNAGTESNSFWDTQTSEQGSSAGGTPKTTQQMKDITTFSGAGWDIVLIGDYVDETWYIDDGNDYPRLGWQF